MKDLRKTVTGRRRMARTERRRAKMERRRERRSRACTVSSQGGSNHSLERIPPIDLSGQKSPFCAPYQPVFMAPDWVAASEEMVKLEPREPESANKITARHMTAFLLYIAVPCVSVDRMLR